MLWQQQHVPPSWQHQQQQNQQQYLNNTRNLSNIGEPSHPQQARRSSVSSTPPWSRPADYRSSDSSAAAASAVNYNIIVIEQYFGQQHPLLATNSG